MLKKGQRVRVFFPPKELSADPLKKWNDKVLVIDKAIHYRATNKGTSFTYTLEGCVSRFGIPYEFLEEWLIPYDVEGVDL